MTSFPTSNLSLSTLTAAYDVGSLTSLNGRYYYGDTSNPATSGEINLPIKMSSFFGKYTSATGSLVNQEAFAQNGVAGHGVEARCGFNSASYVLRGNIVKSLSLNFYLNSRGTGTSSSDGTNSPLIQVYENNNTLVFQENSTGTKNIPLTATSFRISVIGNASNNWGDQATASGSWSYTVTPSGVTGP